MSGKLQGQVALVTGSGRGIGEAIAVAMAKEGAKVVTNGVTSGHAEATAEKIVKMGGHAVPVVCDVSDFEAARKLIQIAVDNFGRLDILVNNAAVHKYSAIWEMTEEDFDWIVGVSLKGAFNCIRHAADLMKRQKWGRIINTTSAWAWRGLMDNCAYSTAKAGVVGLTMAVAREMGRYGVTCNAYSPGAASQMIPREVNEARLRKKLEEGLVTEEEYERVMNLPGPEKVAPFVVYLCTDEAADITGRVFHVVGGHVGSYSEPVEEKVILKAEGMWTLQELTEQVPRII